MFECDTDFRTKDKQLFANFTGLLIDWVNFG